jgi:pimeloyl-ACP methyl ester carboxylesterase
MVWPIARALRRAGYRPLPLGYPSRAWPLDRIVDTLAARIAAERRSARIHIVGHSMGALVTQAIIARHRPEGLDRVVMLGPPLAGSEWVALLRRAGLERLVLRRAGDLLHPDRPAALTAMLGKVDYPLGIIAGDRALDPLLPRLVFPRANDGKVAVAATHVAGQADHIVLPVSHTLMLWNREVHRQILAFLRTGNFDRT